MITQSVRIPRWRAVVLCLAGVLAMTNAGKWRVPLSIDAPERRSTITAPLYGWVEESGPFNANERWRAEQRLRVLVIRAIEFSSREIERAAADVRGLGLAEIRRLARGGRGEIRSGTLADRAVAGVDRIDRAAGRAVLLRAGLFAAARSGSESRSAHDLVGEEEAAWRITFGRLAA